MTMLEPVSLRIRPRLEALIARARSQAPLRIAIVNPIDQADVAALAAAGDFIVPFLVGPRSLIEEAASRAGLSLSACTFVDVPNAALAAHAAVELAQRDAVDVLMKGALHTDAFMSSVLAAADLRTTRRMSHVAVIETSLPRLLFVSDGALNIAPNLDAKRDITQNAIDVARAVGVATPKVAILAAVETVSSNIPATVDAAAVSRMADRGEIVGGVVDGPLALDDAVSPEAARLKGITSPVAGYADVLIAPELNAANHLFKAIEYFSGGACADVVVGARIPLVLTSRADDAFTRVASIALAALCRPSQER